MTISKKVLSILILLFLIIVIPFTVLLISQKQDIRKKASVGGLLAGNLRVDPTTVAIGQTVTVVLEGTGQDTYGYIEGKVSYDPNYLEPVSPNPVWTPINPAHGFLSDSNSFIFGANSINAPLTGQILTLSLRAKQATTSANIKLIAIDSAHPLRAITTTIQSQILGSGSNGIDIAINDQPSPTQNPTPTPNTGATPTETITPVPTSTPGLTPTLTATPTPTTIAPTTIPTNTPTLIPTITATPTIPNPTANGTSITPSPLPLTPTSTRRQGDANNDGLVNGIDYVIWLNNMDKQTTNGPNSGDFNSDGVVDGVDYVVWLRNYQAI